MTGGSNVSINTTTCSTNPEETSQHVNSDVNTRTFSFPDGLWGIKPLSNMQNVLVWQNVVSWKLRVGIINSTEEREHWSHAGLFHCWCRWFVFIICSFLLENPEEHVSLFCSYIEEKDNSCYYSILDFWVSELSHALEKNRFPEVPRPRCTVNTQLLVYFTFVGFSIIIFQINFLFSQNSSHSALGGLLDLSNTFAIQYNSQLSTCTSTMQTGAANSLFSSLLLLLWIIMVSIKCTKCRLESIVFKLQPAEQFSWFCGCGLHRVWIWNMWTTNREGIIWRKRFIPKIPQTRKAAQPRTHDTKRDSSAGRVLQRTIHKHTLCLSVLRPRTNWDPPRLVTRSTTGVSECVLEHLSRIEEAPGPDSGAIRHVTAAPGHRCHDEFDTAAAPSRAAAAPRHSDTRRGRAANGCLHKGRLCKWVTLEVGQKREWKKKRNVRRLDHLSSSGAWRSPED